MLKKKGDGKHCELKSAQTLLLAVPSLEGKVVTSDPLHNQKKTAQITVEKGGDYVQQVKDNQRKLHTHLKKSFVRIAPTYGSPEKGHGRIEQRAIAVLGTNAMKSSFPHARSMIAVWSRRTLCGKTSESIRYFISSLEPGIRTDRQWHQLIRGHWGGVENRNHWSKDAVWGEDGTRSRNPGIVGNLALLRNAMLHIAAEQRENYGSLPALTEALRANPAHAFRLITQRLHG